MHLLVQGRQREGGRLWLSILYRGSNGEGYIIFDFTGAATGGRY
jgi:hypothetical protein